MPVKPVPSAIGGLVVDFCLLKYSKSKSIQDSPSQKYARRRESGLKHEGLQCKQ